MGENGRQAVRKNSTGAWRKKASGPVRGNFQGIKGTINMKYVLIGCGRIAVNHIKAVLNNHLELAAVCDVKPEAMEIPSPSPLPGQARSLWQKRHLHPPL